MWKKYWTAIEDANWEQLKPMVMPSVLFHGTLMIVSFALGRKSKRR